MNNKDTPITQEILRVYRLPLRSRGQSPNLSSGKAKFFITYISYSSNVSQMLSGPCGLRPCLLIHLCFC